MHQRNHAAFAPKRWNGAETALDLRYEDCRFLPNANCGEKNFQSGAKWEGRLGFRKQDIFVLAPAELLTDSVKASKFHMQFKQGSLEL